MLEGWSRGRIAFVAMVGMVAGCSSSPSSQSGVTSDGGSGPPGPLVVQTDHGPVKGVALDSARRFSGIPFAAPPTGNMRWKPPADHAHWTTTLDASGLGPACTGIALTASGGLLPGTSEDCLTINVWTPLSQTSHAPVMVWIYGGAFIGGNGADPAYDGSSLAAGQGVIVVTFNYRLGSLGFLSSQALASEEGASVAPPFGLQDQQAALRWVHANIAAFGGDPGNVTLFGESAGAWSTCAHLTMPGSEGLFQHAIMESGDCGPLFYFTPAAAQAQAAQLAQALGCTDAATELACLRAKDPGSVMNALPGRRALIGPVGVVWGPVVDGAVLPAMPIDSLSAGHFAKVPVLLGSNHDEGNLFTYLWNFSNPQLAASDVLPIAQTNWGMANGSAIASHYTALFSTPVTQVSNFITDGALACPTRRAARAIVASGGVAYLYQFTHPFNPGVAPGLGAAHGFEIPYVWGNPFLGTRTPDADASLVAAMQGYWGRFAAKGDPNGGGSVAWPKYTASGDENIVLDTTITTSSGLKKSACDFWDALP